MDFDIKFMIEALKASLKYVHITIIIAIVPLIIGSLVGIIIAVLRIYNVKIVGKLLQVSVAIIKAIPLVLLLYIVYFQVIKGFDSIASIFNWSIRSKDINSIYIAITAISLSAIASISEVMRAGLLSVGVGQFEASYSVGLTKVQTLRRIVIPQALPVIIPSLCSSFIGLIKGSSIAYLIAVVDIMNGALITATTNYRFLEAYVAAAIVYWILCVLVERMSFRLEKGLSVYINHAER